MLKIKVWLNDCCDTGAGKQSRIRELWNSYREWMESQDGQVLVTLNDGWEPKQSDLREALVSAGFMRSGNKQIWHFAGIAPKPRNLPNAVY